MKKLLILVLSSVLMFTSYSISATNEEMFKKIDLFGEVLEKLKRSTLMKLTKQKSWTQQLMEVLQSLDPYSAYMIPELFNSMQTDTKGEFGGLGIDIHGSWTS